MSLRTVGLHLQCSFQKVKNYNSYHWTTKNYALYTHTGLHTIAISICILGMSAHLTFIYPLK